MATEVMINNVMLVEPKKRGRPKKIVTIEPVEPVAPVEPVESVEPKKRGRPKKIQPISLNSNSNVELINRDDLVPVNIVPVNIVPVNIVPVNEPKKRGRPKKNITITEDTASESSETNAESMQPLAEPKKRGRPKKIQPEFKIENNTEEQPEEYTSNDQEEVEGFYIKLDRGAINGYRYVTSVSDAEYLITDQFRVYDKTTFVFCGLLEDMIRQK
jgi:hypothetical protein